MKDGEIKSAVATAESELKFLQQYIADQEKKPEAYGIVAREVESRKNQTNDLFNKLVEQNNRYKQTLE